MLIPQTNSLRQIPQSIAAAGKRGGLFGVVNNRGRNCWSTLSIAAALTSMTAETPDAPFAKAAFAWCCVASSSTNADDIIIERVKGYTSNHDGQQQGYLRSNGQHGRPFDITAIGDWMEFIERTENRTHDSGGAGAYDAYRCDWILDSNNNSSNNISRQQQATEDRWRIWGQDFHLHRLQESYRSIDPKFLLGQTGNDLESNHVMAKQPLETAVQKSKRMVRALLYEAEKASILQAKADQNTAWEDVSIQLIRVTILWSPPHDENQQQQQGSSDASSNTTTSSSSSTNDIIVRAHACSTGIPFGVHQTVQPIQVTIAAKHQLKSHDVVMDTAMPTRLGDPQHKIASWTRLRKKMEQPETYKPPGVSEVLMVRPNPLDPSETEVLEGVSSNVFVVYRDGTLRTAQDGVLYGYARQLVLEHAEACNLTMDDSKPIVLQDAENGFWKEAFITSSSRLIYPISKVLMHGDNEQDEFVEYWRDPVLTGEAILPVGEKQKWQQLLDRILQKGGYPRFC